MQTNRQPYPNEIMHYGILGMKWGVRRYQNADGTLTNAGKKRYATSIKKAITKTGVMKTNAFEIKKEVSKDLLLNSERSSAIKNVDSVLRSLEEYRNAEKEKADFDYSDEYKEASEKAYSNTIAYLKKNDPAYLKDIIERNHGSYDQLDQYHDFRKLFEGFEDEALTEAENRFYSDPDKRASKDKADRAYNEYIEECKKAADDLVGQYGKQRLPNYGVGNAYKDVQDLITDAVGDFAAQALKNIYIDRKSFKV